MSKYLISMASGAMDHVTDDLLPEVDAAAHAVVRQAQEAGVWFFAGGLSEDDPPVSVDVDGTVSPGDYPLAGMAIVDVPSREEALQWAATFAAACRCPQTLCEIMYDPLV